MSKYKEYLLKRGIGDHTISKFGIGHCDSSGNCSHLDYMSFVDFRFYDTVLFPIKDLYNSIIGVAARSVDVKKYIHSKYTKSKHLFGLNITYEEILRTKKVFIVEGNFDLLTLYEHGITNVVAMLGSKLSLEQLGLLIRFAKEIVIATDGDIPGKACANKIISMLKENDVSFRQLNLPVGADPDSFIRNRGVDAFLRLQSPDLLERVKRI